MNAFKMNKNKKNGKSGEPVHQSTMVGSSHMKGISPTSAGPLGLFYSTGPVLSLKPLVQAKLTIGQPNDRYEQEADQVADQVMRMPEGSLVQRESTCPECMEEEEKEELIQTKGEGGDSTPEVTSNIESRIHSLKGGGQPLSESSRSFFEPRFGTHFSDVRVHSDTKAAQLAHAMNARAYTLGRDIVFGDGQNEQSSNEGKQLLAHELIHVLQQRQTYFPAASLGGHLQSGHMIQRAEVDDNPTFCFPPGGTPLSDSKSTINSWITGTRSTSQKNAIHIVNAVYKDLGTGTGVTQAEKKIASLPESQVRHVSMAESRYAGAMMWPTDPLTRMGLWVAGKIFVSPLINLCGVCIGADKVGHFFQQGYEYFRLGQEIRARVEAMPLEERKNFYERLTAKRSTEEDLPFLPSLDFEGPFLKFEYSPETYTEFIADVFASQFGLWLEGFNNNLSPEDIKWIKSRKFIPFYYSEGIYGSATTGILSRADLQANIQGYRFYRDLWQNPSKALDICDYVGELWNERKEVSTFLPEVGSPTGPGSSSMEAASP